MRTIVYQSFRTKDVPVWINLCLESVRQWAQTQGFEYRFYDDRFFDLVPDAVRPRASAYKCLLADYARLVAARNLLAEGWDRAIWVDADALVFAPKEFTIPFTEGYAFSREIWLDRIAFGKPHFKLQVNNAVSVFCRDQKIIDFALDVADAILLSDQTLAPTSIGTEFLSKLQRAYHFPLLNNVGIFGPEMARRYLANDGEFLTPYLSYQTSPIFADNLCLSHQPAGSSATAFSDDDLVKFINRLKTDQGRSLNAWFSPNYAASKAEFDRPLSRYVAARQALGALSNSLRGK